LPDLGWLAGALAVTVLAAAAYSAGRVIAGALLGRRAHYDVDITHVLMGASMAGMFVADLSFLSAAAWKLTFTVVLAWYALRALAGSQDRDSARQGQGLLFQTGHLLSVAAMLYMLQAVPSPATGAMKSPNMAMDMALPSVRTAAHPRALSLLIAALLLGYAALAVSRARRVVRIHAGGGADALPLAPRAAAACEVVMCTAMAAMLFAAS
jgi:hypothetical protein